MEHLHAHAHAHAHAPQGPQLADIVPGLALPELPARAVDVGCGSGEDVRWLHEAGFEAIGVDVSADALRVAADRTPPEASITWLEASATRLPLPDHACALVTDRGCLHHLAPREQEGYAQEVGRVLAAGGAWIIRDVVGHRGQVADLSVDGIGQLAEAGSLRVESCDVEAGSDGGHDWLVAVLRRR